MKRTLDLRERESVMKRRKGKGIEEANLAFIKPINL